ncbi:NADP-dependent malic enzyme [Candidatus Uhrbacteria bacterium]|nr:NADP-dependent malic enzyme [Candidatus Uhrbacteria bacterium]
MADINRQSLLLHKKHGGKLSVVCKVPLRNKHDLAVAYTPGVARVCEEIASDKSLAKTYTLKRNTVAVITDGSAVLGLGNIGALAALPVMEGKCALFKRFADIDAFPICLDTQDSEEIVDTIKRIAPVFGGINLEDIAAPRCFEIERRLREELDIPVLHDDQHGTAVVVLAALINSLKVKKLSKKRMKIVINGAGAAGTAVATLLASEGYNTIIVCDSRGAIYKERKKLEPHKQLLAKISNPRSYTGDLSGALRDADVFIGVSVKNILSPSMIKGMSDKPIIFALANPEPEIHPLLAKKAGASIVATGRSDFPNQINNVLAFPGIFRGALDTGVHAITATMLQKAAYRLAAIIPDPRPTKILPSPFEKGVVRAVSSAIQKKISL